MTTATITKTLKKVNANINEFSLGFNRWNALPSRIIRNLDLAIYLKNGHINNMFNEKNAMFANMTESEFINWMKLA